MARVRDVPIDEVSKELQPLYRKFSQEYGNFANQVAVLAHSPSAMRHLYGLLSDWREEPGLSQRLMEIAVLTVSHVNRCPYCVAHHAPALVGLGLAPETVEHIMDPEPPGLTQEERLVRDYARLVAERPWGIRDAVFEELRRYFSDRQIVELTVRIGLCGLFNKLNDALQIETEDGVLAGMVAPSEGQVHRPRKSPA